jgi:hypothetical protein
MSLLKPRRASVPAIRRRCTSRGWLSMLPSFLAASDRAARSSSSRSTSSSARSMCSREIPLAWSSCRSAALER